VLPTEAVVAQVSDTKGTPLAARQPATEPGDAHRVRNDIEGLRAVAVLSVLFNHAYPNVLPGGFAGVDIFFVISGYLIGRHLLQDIQAGRFSFLRFYARRARRIFPALTLVLISAWIAGWLLYSAPELEALGRHIVTSAFFSNNFLLWSESGYFDAAALDKPLLHLWSLGIEEQFYLLVPALLWIGTKGTSGSIRWVARLGVLSLLATIVVGDRNYASSFYLLHTRFWELAAGVILAQAELRTTAHANSQKTVQSASKRDITEVLVFSLAFAFFALVEIGSGGMGWQWDAVLSQGGLTLAFLAAITISALTLRCERRQEWTRLSSWFKRHAARFATAASVAGIALIVVPIAELNSMDWPGPKTLLLVFGAVLVIAAGPTAVFNRILAKKSVAFVGGISYPLYLWHWPLIVFFRLQNPNPPATETSILLAAAFVLAWLTKVLLEEPVRFGKLGRASFKPPRISLVVLALELAALLGWRAVATDGSPTRFPPLLRAVAEWSENDPDAPWRVGRCYHYPGDDRPLSIECTPVKRPDVPLILLWGDSHAAHLYAGMIAQQSAMTFDIAQWTSAGCPPTVKPVSGESRTCPQRRATAMAKLGQLSPDTVVLGGAWERYIESGVTPGDIINTVSETVRWLKNKGARRIVIFGPGPVWTTSLSVDLFRFMARNRSKRIPERLGTVSGQLWLLDSAMSTLATAGNVQYVSVLNFFCDKGGCLTVGDRTMPRPDLLYRDRDHLTVSGSKLLVAHSKPQLFGETR
jgi:peptidoglycan/LPS O-acetylase OafA/YrhL